MPDLLEKALAFASPLSVTYEQDAPVSGPDGERKCPICHRETTDLVGDHCHATGRSRDRICRACNVGLGMFYDDPEALRRAARYLERWHRAIQAHVRQFPALDPAGGPTAPGFGRMGPEAGAGV